MKTQEQELQELEVKIQREREAIAAKFQVGEGFEAGGGIKVNNFSELNRAQQNLTALERSERIHILVGVQSGTGVAA
jgi:glutathione synthase/RimK-type ligase-like ATP-grasp enzyme